jgi:hypothetical protein
MDMLEKDDSVRDEQFNSEPASLPVSAENTDEHAPENKNEIVAPENMEPVAEIKPEPSHEELHEILHHAEGEDEEEFNDDPANILENTYIEEEHKELVEDYSILTKEEIIKTLDFLLKNKPVETIRQNVESLKINFYKKVRAELDALRKAAEDRGEDPEAVVLEPDEAEERLKDLLRQYRDQKTAFNEKVEAEKQQNLKEKYKIIDEIKDLVKPADAPADASHHPLCRLQRRQRCGRNPWCERCETP